MRSRFTKALSMLAATAALVHCSGTDATFPTSSGAGGSTSTFAGGTGGTGSATLSGGTGGAGSTTASGGTGGAGGASSGSGAGGCQPVLCQGKQYLCGNCLDDDGDGKIDSHDGDCLGPCDNTEDKLDLGIPGAGNAPCKRDCYFDKDSGDGNDDCQHDLRCDPLSPEKVDCEYQNPPPPNADCPPTQSDTCTNVCKPLTPNGCDCFGCCELPGGSGKFVYLGSKDANDAPTCTIKNAGDPSKCHPCTPFGNCFNACDKCELCLGKETLPPECTPDDQCKEGQPCGLEGQAECPPGQYCLTGCCVVPNPT